MGKIIVLKNGKKLRYGENPHQTGYFFEIEKNKKDPLNIQNSKQLCGKEISFNNILDIDAGLYIVSQLGGKKPACAIIKHTNPAGAALASDIIEAYTKAWQGDPLASFGSIIVVNRNVEEDLASVMLKDKKFFEILLAPEVEDEALKIFNKKKNLIVLVNPALRNPRPFCDIDYKKVRGGFLVQEQDSKQIRVRDLRFVTENKSNRKQIEDLLFAWKLCKVCKSNAVVIVKNLQLISSSVGQQDRMRCCKLAIDKAGKGAEGAVAASDAFFPFPDGPKILIKAGVLAIIHPGGSIRDQETINLCNKTGTSMVFTGIRCFRH